MKEERVILQDKGKTQLISHSGYKGGVQWPNTCAAFIISGTKEYYGIETDMHETKDGRFILRHNIDVPNNDGDMINIPETDFAELRKIRMIDRDGETVREDYFLPSLEEYIHICRAYDKQAILELKSVRDIANLANVVAIVRKMDWYERTTFISFNRDYLLFIREKYPDTSAWLLSGVGDDETLDFIIKHRLGANLQFKCVTKEKVDKLHAHGLPVGTYTVNKLDLAETLISWGVDYITTDIIE